jgi:hypothetical protein
VDIKKKELAGQSSLEYILSYGWAILVLFVIGYALWELGVLRDPQQGASYSGFPRITPQMASTGMSADGDFTGVFVNSAGRRIYLTGVMISASDGSILCCSHSSLDSECNDGGIDIVGKTAAQMKNDGGVFVSEGDPFKIIIEGCTISGAASGQRYEVSMVILYNMTSDRYMMPSQDSGKITGFFE